MSNTWESQRPARVDRVTGTGWLILALRLVVLLAIIVPGVIAVLVLRLVETFFFDRRRPLTARLQRWAIWAGLHVIGLRYRREGRPMQSHGAVVANHASWLDIFALGAGQAITFVSKAEVAGWPGIGFLARIVGTVFISRNPRQADAQRNQLKAELDAGRKLLFFPEGTSTDGMRVLPFKSSLFAAFSDLEAGLRIQPVTVVYIAPDGLEEPRFYGWWGDMDLGPHMLQVLSRFPQGGVRVIYHEPISVSDYPDRKALARTLEAKVRSAMPPEVALPG
ncbi:2-acyl-glycerophospho-ethanolamine acyltransferase [Roseovarius sp. THAF9]|uniref:lysophospholipid acyltransferase family protein n=1 Tax=Roseovarius sp. THAF9 TaxID=2587847 RepID=UPI0012682C7A|nr:lysophospholipid acyltransferase family protein [Roseovarius sp. THAF9]QFT92890.1 2-acyl-glycerophospho-ethanolamine acyltransferase [Roseovarius sp. THAF9]